MLIYALIAAAIVAAFVALVMNRQRSGKPGAPADTGSDDIRTGPRFGKED